MAEENRNIGADHGYYAMKTRQFSLVELMCELPWRAEKFTKEEWIKQYIRARYGTDDESCLLYTSRCV